MYQSLVVNAQSKSEYAAFKSKLDKEVKIYINVLYHERVKGPLDEKGAEVPVSAATAAKEWKQVPFSVLDAETRKSEAFGYAVYFFQLVLNDKLYAFLTQKNTPKVLEGTLAKYFADKL